MSEIDWLKAPEGATHYLPETSEFAWFPCWVKEDGSMYYIMLADGIDTSWEHDDEMDDCIPHLVKRPSPVWNGEGLPPVGTVCEVYHCDEWAAGEVIAHFQQKAGMVAAYTVEVGDGIKHLDCAIGECFRPIRTPEQIAAEERKAAIDSMVQFFMNYYGNPKGAEQYLLICRSLHDAGYRKQEQQK